MRELRVFAVVAAVGIMVWACGCGKKGDKNETGGGSADSNSSQSAEASAPEVGDIKLSTVLAAWRKGDRYGSVEKFLAVWWEGPAAWADTRAMKMSEEELASLPAAERQAIVEEALGLTKTLRDVVRQTLLLGDETLKGGDKETARAYYEAVERCGQALSGPERLVVIQVAGKAMVTAGQDKLRRMK